MRVVAQLATELARSPRVRNDVCVRDRVVLGGEQIRETISFQACRRGRSGRRATSGRSGSGRKAEAITCGGDEQPPVWEEVGAEGKRLHGRDDFALSLELDANDLLGAPVREPQAVRVLAGDAGIPRPSTGFAVRTSRVTRCSPGAHGIASALPRLTCIQRTLVPEVEILWTGVQCDPGRVVVGPVPVPGCVLGPCGRSFSQARWAFFSVGDFEVRPGGSSSTTLPSTTFGSGRSGMPCLRAHAANWRTGRRTNETGLASNVIHAPTGRADGPLSPVVVTVVVDVIVDPGDCARAEWDEPSATAASRPEPSSIVSVATRPLAVSRARRRPVGPSRVAALSAMSVPRFEVAGESQDTLHAKRLQQGYRRSYWRQGRRR